MAWGILMTVVTLLGMMVLAIREATTSECSSQASSENVAQERPSTEQPELPKAA